MKEITLLMAAAICILTIAGCSNGKSTENTSADTSSAVSGTDSTESSTSKEETTKAAETTGSSETTALVEDGDPKVTFEAAPIPETAGARADLLDRISEVSSFEAMMKKSDCVVFDCVFYDKDGAEQGTALMRFTPDGNGGYNYDYNTDVDSFDEKYVVVVCANARNYTFYIKTSSNSYITIYPEEEFFAEIKEVGTVFLHLGTWPEISHNEYGEYKFTEENLNSDGSTLQIDYLVNPETYEVRAIETRKYSGDEIVQTISTVIRYDYTEAELSDAAYAQAESGDISFTAVINPDTEKEETRSYKATADYKINAPKGYAVYSDRECTQSLSDCTASEIPETIYIAPNKEQ